MTSAWSQLEQMLTCAICLDKFKNPRLLPCQHSFCGDACMEGLVDYARRQIKCPECRAEHRIPYQGVSSLPSNVTLTRFLELHSRITGEEPEPVPTFMEKCSVCGEKVDGVQRCAHCEKKVCPECKEAHVDLLRREITRINGQAKRCLSKMQEFRDTLNKSQERLTINQTTVKHEIEESCKRLINDLQAKQKRLIEEVDLFAEQENKTIDKLRVAIADELATLEANSRLADEKISNKFPWTDHELSEMKEIYAKAMEFVRLFDPEIGDFSRKIRFTLMPEFDTMRRRICELGELKFGESASSLIASSFQYCNATGAIALELCNAAAAQAAAMAACASGSAGYGLSHSNSNTNLGASGIQSSATMLELPSMQNALMRSQSDHRLASQFQQRLKQQQQQQQEASSKNGSRYGARDYETDSLRSRYAPPRGSKDYGTDLLTRDWPRPSDNDAPDFSSSIHFKSAFMRRKEKERQQLGSYGGAGAYANEDDDDLTSEASYGGAGARNVRFYDQAANEQHQSLARQQPAMKLFDCKEVEHAPLSGIPKLEDSPHLNTRLHQMGAKAIVDKKRAEEEGQRDKDLVESAQQAMNKASQRNKQRQMSVDEIEKQKQANKQQQESQQLPDNNTSQAGSFNSRQSGSSNEQSIGNTTASRSSGSAYGNRVVESPRHSPTPTADLNSNASTVVEVEPASAASRSSASTSAAQPATVPSPTSSSASGITGGRRGLYGQAVTEKSKRQLSNAIQDAASYSRRRAAPAASSSIEGEQTPDASSTASSSNGRTKRTLRSSGRSLSKQSSVDQSSIGGDGSVSTPTQRRRRVLARGESSQQSLDGSGGGGSGSPAVGANPNSSTATTSNSTPGETQSKNYATGSGGHSDNSQSSHQGSLTAGQESEGRRPVTYSSYSRTSTTADQTSTTTDDDADLENLEEERRRPKALASGSSVGQYGSRRLAGSGSAGGSTTRRPIESDKDEDQDDDGDNKNNNRVENDDEDEDNANDVDDEDDEDEDEDEGEDDDGDTRTGSRSGRGTGGAANGYSGRGRRNTGNRRSREMLPNAVNKLLDRSAQIRRDSQEQRSRGDSPQRVRPRTDYSAPSSQSSYYSGASVGSGSGSQVGSGAAAGYSTTGSSAARQRLAYQRSQSIRDNNNNNNNDDDTTNSNNSLYTTASSGGSHAHRSSLDDDSSTAANRRMSGNSTDRTLTSSDLNSTRVGYHRHDSSGDRPSSSSLSSVPAYQSRFLNRSRTSAALASSSIRSQDSVIDSADSGATLGDSTTSSSRAYLSSRDRFMQSAAAMSPSSTSASGAQITSGSSSGSSNLYSRTGSGSGGGTSAVRSPASLAVSSLGQYRHQPTTPAHFSDNSPFVEFDDEDDEYSAYFPSGFKTHSEYLRNKFSGRRTSSNSSGSSALLRSRSSHATFTRNSDDEDEEEDELVSRRQRQRRRTSNALNSDDDDDDDESGSESEKSYSRRGSGYGLGSRRSSLLNASMDSQSSCSAPRTVYSQKRRMLFKLGSRGSEPGNFTWPRGVAVGLGARGREIVVADSSNHRVQVFDSNGKFLNEFGSYGSAKGEFDCLAGVAINRVNKNYVVSDRYNHRIQVFDMSGKFVRSFGELGRDSGKFNLPWGVACDISGLVYVCDKENHRIQVFDVDGTYLNKFGVSGNQAGQLQHPHYIAVGAGKVVVTDTNNHRVQVFDLSGSLIQSFGKEGSSNGQFKFPRGVAMDELGHIIVGDSGNNRLQIFNSEGSFVKSIGTWGSAEGEFKGIEGVAVDTNHNILVCDRENHRIQVF